jgi:hypothetical protein
MGIKEPGGIESAAQSIDAAKRGERLLSRITEETRLSNIRVQLGQDQEYLSGLEDSQRDREVLEKFKDFLATYARYHREEAQDWVDFALGEHT